MGKQGKGITQQEEGIIRKMMEEGIKPKAIATKIKRSANYVYEFLRKNEISIPRPNRSGKVADAKVVEFTDLSSLPDHYLFKHVAHAIP
jgi:Tc3 transposase